VIRYRGLTWDHPRGYNALATAAQRLDEARDGIAIVWNRQPLVGFESHPIGNLCRQYDLVVLDHPHVGEAVAGQCLVPMEELFAPDEIATWSRETIGPCLASYRHAGLHWALPLDAATQVMALRVDVADEQPHTWAAVLSLSERQPVALSIAGPHAILTFFSLAVAFGESPADVDPAALISTHTGEQVLDVMSALYARMPVDARGLNPIGLLGAMSSQRDAGEIALCPLVYGYVNYAVPQTNGAARIVFHNAPRASDGGRPGSTLGGTGIGISRGCRITGALLDHLRWLMSRDVQVEFIPMHDGQPSRREAWWDEAVNMRCGNFYRNTADTLEQAYVRPRHKRYIAFQTEAAELLRRGLDERTPHRLLLERLQAAFERSRPRTVEV
jgi:multiple sugar transport system substrate-binding protein